MASGIGTIVIRVKLPGEGGLFTSGFHRRCIYSLPSGDIVLRLYRGTIGEGTCRTPEYRDSDDYYIYLSDLVGTRVEGTRLVIDTKRGNIEITACEEKKKEGCSKIALEEVDGYLNRLIENYRVKRGLSTLKHEEDVSKVLSRAAETVRREGETSATLTDLEKRLRGLRGGRKTSRKRSRSSKRKINRRKSSRRRV